MTKNRIDDLIQQVGELPPMPQAAQKAMALIRDPNSSMARIASVLALDPVMTGLVLRWANSAYYSLTYPITTVNQAVVYLGQNTIQSLVLAASVASLLNRPVPGYNLDRGDLWKHSVGVAAAARLAISWQRRDLAEEAYHAGLLCDIGKLAFEMVLRNMTIDPAEREERTFTEIETGLFGVDHAALGAELARRWNLPEGLQAAIAYHHNPANAGEHLLLASAVHIGDTILMMMGIGIGKDGLRYRIDPAALETLEADENRVLGLVEPVLTAVKEAEVMIGMIH
jgi:HD-like signal output (HDOD) protein